MRTAHFPISGGGGVLGRPHLLFADLRPPMQTRLPWSCDLHMMHAGKPTPLDVSHVTRDTCWEANPPSTLWIEWQTRVKTLPCPKLHFRAVITKICLSKTRLPISSPPIVTLTMGFAAPSQALHSITPFEKW